MRTLKTILDFYLDASIHVAIAVISLTGVTFYLLGSSLDINLLGFIFFSVIVCYNFIKYGVEAYKYLIVSNAYHKVIQIFSFISFVFAICFLLRLDKAIWVATLVLGVLSALYAVPLLPRAKNLRNLAGLKIYIVAFVWAGFSVLLPVLDANMPLNWDFALTFIQRMLLVLVLILPFEIRDIQWDDKGLRTLSQVLGVKVTRRLGMGLSIIFFLLTFLKDELHQLEIVLRLVLSVALIFALASNKRLQSRYFVMFWVEAIPIFWFCLFWCVESYF
ncbi:MAG: UbiA prenyltransferase family protein [Flagellimonas sp.]